MRYQIELTSDHHEIRYYRGKGKGFTAFADEAADFTWLGAKRIRNQIWARARKSGDWRRVILIERGTVTMITGIIIGALLGWIITRSVARSRLTKVAYLFDAEARDYQDVMRKLDCSEEVIEWIKDRARLRYDRTMGWK